MRKWKKISIFVREIFWSSLFVKIKKISRRELDGLPEKEKLENRARICTRLFWFYITYSFIIYHPMINLVGICYTNFFAINVLLNYDHYILTINQLHSSWVREKEENSELADWKLCIGVLLVCVKRRGEYVLLCFYLFT